MEGRKAQHCLLLANDPMQNDKNSAHSMNKNSFCSITELLDCHSCVGTEFAVWIIKHDLPAMDYCNPQDQAKCIILSSSTDPQQCRN